MDFDLGTESDAFRKSISESVTPGLEQLNGLAAQPIPRLRDTVVRWQRLLAPTGYLELGVEDGMNSVMLAVGRETLASLCPSFFITVESGVRLFGRLIGRYGTPGHREKLLPELKRGDLITAVALTEGHMNVADNPLRTRGVRTGETVEISGAKSSVRNGPVADWIGVVGMLENSPAVFLLTPDTEGLAVGEPVPALAYEAVPAPPLDLDRASVAPEMVVSAKQGADLLGDLRQWEDEILTAAGLGLINRSFSTARDYAKSHVSGGKPIIAYQEVGFKLAEMLTLLQTARLLAYRAAWMAAVGDPEAGVVSRCAKVFCSECAEEVSSQALQILGGRGMVHGNPAEESYRDAKYLQVAGTSSEISRMKIADRVLGA